MSRAGTEREPFVVEGKRGFARERGVRSVVAGGSKGIRRRMERIDDFLQNTDFRRAFHGYFEGVPDALKTLKEAGKRNCRTLPETPRLLKTRSGDDSASGKAHFYRREYARISETVRRPSVPNLTAIIPDVFSLNVHDPFEDAAKQYFSGRRMNDRAGSAATSRKLILPNFSPVVLPFPGG